MPRSARFAAGLLVLICALAAASTASAQVVGLYYKEV